MNNNITEDYCSFEVAKLLKERGFIRQYIGLGLRHGDYYNENGEFNGDAIKALKNKQKGLQSGLVAAPTHALTIKWIRENFGININVFPELNTWDANISSLKKEKGCLHYMECYDTPEAATEAALLYTLTNLIKTP